MKTSRWENAKTVVVIVALFAFLFASPGLADPRADKLAILPFRINAEKDLTFLRDGIVDMLTSRLYWEDRVEVIGRQKTAEALAGFSAQLTQQQALAIGAKLGADYVLYGSLTVFGESVSIDASMADLSGKNPPLAFFEQTRGMEEVIPKINLFAAEINEKVFGREAARKTPATTAAEAPQMDIYAHPEKLLKEGFDAGGQAAEGSPFIKMGEPGASPRQFWKSPNYSELFIGLALADVNGDGKTETVVITPNELQLYRLEENRFFKIDTIARDRNLSHIGVDAADINGNGVAEIFVSSLNIQKNAARSFVVEYNGSQYAEIVGGQKWFYRVADTGSMGKVLIGQRQTSADPFAGGCYRMFWENTRYEPGDPILFPKRNNLLGLTYGDILNNGTDQVVAYNDQDYIQIFAASGKPDWEEKESRGGSMLYFALPPESPGDLEERRYLSSRLIIRDIDGDGRNELIAVNNVDVARRYLVKFRSYTHSSIEIFRWDGVGLSMVLKTSRITGYISDFAIGDIDNDGKDELAATVVLKEGSVIGTQPRSTIIVYELDN